MRRRDLTLGLLSAGVAAEAARAQGRPAAVTAKGLGEVYDLRGAGKAGLSATPRKTLTANRAEFETGGNRVDNSDPTNPIVYLKRPGAYEGWDLSGRAVFIDETGRFAFRNCRFGPYANPPGRGAFRPALAIGLSDNPEAPAHTPEVLLTNCLLDGRCTSWNATVIAHQTGRLTAHRCRFTNGSGTYITSSSVASGTTLTLTENAFDSPAYNASTVRGESHCETVHISGGTAYVARNLMDARDGPNRLDYVMAGFFMIQARNAPIVATLENNVMIGAGPVKMPYAMQIDGNARGVAATVRDNVLEAGAFGGYIAETPGRGLKLVKAGNVDFKSGTAALR